MSTVFIFYNIIILAVDDLKIFAFNKGDKIEIINNPKKVYFGELGKNYFSSSLKEKFYRK